MNKWIFATFLTCLFTVVCSLSSQNPAVCTIGGIDLVFVLDVSGSIGAANFQMIREFAEQISGLLDIGLRRSLVGVILFGSTASVHFPVTQHTSDATLLPAINPNLPYSGGGTNTADALNLLRIAGQAGGDLKLRPGVSHIAIVVTDGASNSFALTMQGANSLHASGIYDQVYAVGVSGANINELNAIASNPSLVFFTSNFDNAAVTALQESVTQRLCNMVAGDPHFMVPLLSNDTLCYSIQGYPGLSFNLIYTEDYIINALFIDSINDAKEATWIGKLAVVPRYSNKSEAVIFDSVTQTVVLVDQGHFRASAVDKVVYDEMGKMSVKFVTGMSKYASHPKVHVEYEKPFASFDITFFNHHLDVNWNIKYDSVPKVHGLMGQFMVKGMIIDPLKKILVYPDDHDPVAVEMDNVMVGKTCWKAMNPGHQGEGLIKGSVLDYMVSNLLDNDFKLKDF